jgi:hypothetical protein
MIPVLWRACPTRDDDEICRRGLVWGLGLGPVAVMLGGTTLPRTRQTIVIRVNASSRISSTGWLLSASSGANR